VRPSGLLSNLDWRFDMGEFRTEMAWAAGLFEGEGSLGAYRSGRNGSGKSVVAQASLGMTDRDSVERFHRVVGIGSVYVHRPGTDSVKPVFTWHANSFESVQAVVAMLWFGLGTRRRAKAREVLAATRHTQAYGKRPNCPRGHPYSGDNLWREPIVRGGRSYFARRCQQCRRAQARERAAR